MLVLAAALWPASPAHRFAALVASLVLALASYRFVEQPLRRAARDAPSASERRARPDPRAMSAAVADFRDVFCRAGTCSTRAADGSDLYLPDGYHLNRAGSSHLRDEFARLLG